MQSSNEAQRFSDDEVQNLREIFDLFDKEKQGQIDAKDLETIMGSLQRDPSEVQDFVDQLGEFITFEQFIDLMQNIENKIVNSGEQPTSQDGNGPQHQQLQQQQPVQAGITSI